MMMGSTTFDALPLQLGIRHPFATYTIPISPPHPSTPLLLYGYARPLRSYHVTRCDRATSRDLTHLRSRSLG
jgi:hypothetical protein